MNNATKPFCPAYWIHQAIRFAIFLIIKTTWNIPFVGKIAGSLLTLMLIPYFFATGRPIENRGITPKYSCMEIFIAYMIAGFLMFAWHLLWFGWLWRALIAK